MRRPGDVAEWLGRGLQSLVQRFESARRLFRPFAGILWPLKGGLYRTVFGAPAALPVLAESLHRGLLFCLEECK